VIIDGSLDLPDATDVDPTPEVRARRGALEERIVVEPTLSVKTRETELRDGSGSVELANVDPLGVQPVADGRREFGDLDRLLVVVGDDLVERERLHPATVSLADARLLRDLLPQEPSYALSNVEPKNPKISSIRQ